MSWSIGFDDNWKRDIGYGVPAECDHPECAEKIDRGLSYVCGGEPYGGEHGCGLFFCSDHMSICLVDGDHVQLCECCASQQKPFDPKPDVPEWIHHKQTDPSWAEWRKEQEGAKISEKFMAGDEATVAKFDECFGGEMIYGPRDRFFKGKETRSKELVLNDEVNEAIERFYENVKKAVDGNLAALGHMVTDASIINAFSSRSFSNQLSNNIDEPAQVPIGFSVEGKHWYQINFANHFAADFGQYHTDELSGMWSLLNLNKLYEAMFLK